MKEICNSYSLAHNFRINDVLGLSLALFIFRLLGFNLMNYTKLLES